MHHKTIQTAFFLVLLIGAFIASFFLIRPFIGALVLAFTLAIVFHPLYRKLRSGFQNHHGVAALLTILIILVVVLVPLTFLSVQVFQEGSDFYFEKLTRPDIPVFQERILSLSQWFPGSERQLTEWSANLNQYLQQGLIWLLEHVGVVFSSIAQLLFNLFISLIALYYLFKQGGQLKARLVSISPLSDHFDADITGRLQSTVSSVIRGVIVVAIVQALLAGTGFAIFGIPSPALWGTLAMLAAFIPGIGTALVMIPAVIYLFATGHIGSAIGLAIWGVAVVGLVDNFLSPYLVGRGVKIHPFLILLSVLGGLALFGPLGFLLGPLVISFLFALLDIYPILILKEHTHEQS